MRWLAAICVLTVAISFALFGQSAVPAKWIGTWKLDVRESTFGVILLPGPPADFKILSQTVKIERAAEGIRISGDTAFSAGGGSDTSHDDTTLSLDGAPTNVGDNYASLSFRQIDDSIFEIFSSLNEPNTNVSEVSRYVFASDGKRLTATKIQTERALVPAGEDKSKGTVIRTSKFVLVYDKLP